VQVNCTRNQLLPGTVEVNLGQPELTECGSRDTPGQMGDDAAA
jgi:hypothetical protein